MVANFLYGQERTLKDDDSFLGEGIVDSTGVLQLVAFLEETYGILGWKGDPAELRCLALAPELDLEDEP